MSKQSFSILEGVITIGALVTSTAAVYIAWDQAQTMRVEQHASVFPAIQIDRMEGYTNGDGLKIGFSIENAGVGPAFIESARLLQGGAALTGYEEVTSLVPSNVDLEFSRLTGRVMAPGVSKEAFSLSWHSIVIPTEKVEAAYAATDDWQLEVCYCSTLKRCWMSQSGQRTHPKQVDACHPPEDGLF